MKLLRISTLTLLLSSLPLPLLPVWAQQRGMTTNRNERSTSEAAGQYYALIIGIDRYAALPQLQTAVHDAETVAQVLREGYGFQTNVLLNGQATRDNIMGSLAKYRAVLKQRDSLLIYYAGHGQSDKEADEAYWLPVDAETVVSPRRISADDITKGIRVIPARHVLVISDSCYSGALTREITAGVRPADNAIYLQKMVEARSRTLMASGGDEPVADGGPDGHSVFAYYVLQGLTQSGQAMFTAKDLFNASVLRQVAGRSAQIPSYNPIRGSADENGDFVFAQHGAMTMAVNKPGSGTSSTRTMAAAAETPDSGEALYNTGRYREALPLLTESCENHHITSCRMLGVLYDDGKGVPSDVNRAVDLYRTACDGGDPKACRDLGMLYAEDKRVTNNDALAATLYRKSCENKDAEGCSLIGFLYSQGRGVTRNDKEAVLLFVKGCDLGSVNGCGNAGTMYYLAVGVAQDLAKAVGYWEKACDGNNGKACDALGGAFEVGEGRPKNIQKAKELYAKSCTLGDAQGCEARDRLH